MLKLKKKLKHKKPISKNLYKFNASKRYKKFLRIRKSFKWKCQFSNPTFRKVSSKNLSNSFYKHLNIKVKSNNVFCTLVNKNKMVYVTSSGKCGTKTSKKTLRYSSKVVIQSFFDNIKPYLNQSKFLVNIIGPKKIRKSILEQFSNNLKGKDLIINVKGKKCFNGCRPPKKIRKKQKRLRIFK
jgi:ribosomal protein S11|tara:strand:- start:48 stop:596 length:549 start_codon:yes stop_codon:yes gene_type:complete